MQMVFLEDHLHEMSNLIFWEKWEKHVKTPSVDIFYLES